MKQRIITAIVGIIITIPIILYGNWPFILFAYILGTIALFEMIRMYKPKFNLFFTLLSTVFLWFMLVPIDDFEINSFSLTKFELIMMLSIILLVASVLTKNNFTFDHASFLVLATIYVGISFYFVIKTRLLGLDYFLFILFTIWATDSGAYFIGKYYGKRKLWPAISPNKTIGGAIGGILFALMFAFIFYLFDSLDRSLISILLLAFIISIAGQIGDLVASAIKRHYNIKDFGNLLPGHGGILDRLDSFLFVVLVLHIFQVLSS